MNQHNRLKNLQIVFLVLLVAVAVEYWLDVVPHYSISSIDLGKISMAMGRWSGTDYAVGPGDQQRVENGDMMVRKYEHGAHHLYLVAIQERGDRHRVHSPVNCYTGSGWAVEQRGTAALNGQGVKTVRRLLVSRDGRHRLVYYWFTNGKQSCATFTGHLFYYLKGLFFQRISHSWAYFDVSADVVHTVAETEAALQDFVGTMEKALFLKLPAASTPLAPPAPPA